MDKGPLEFFHGEYAPYLTVGIATIGGGLVSYFDKMKKFSWKNFSIHMLSSSFAGFLVALTCQGAGITGPLVGALAGLAAHMGTPAVVKALRKVPAINKVLGDEEAK